MDADIRYYYEAIFTNIGSALPTTVEQLGILDNGNIGDSMAEYQVIRGTRAFPLYFIRGKDGIWRIGET